MLQETLYIPLQLAENVREKIPSRKRPKTPPSKCVESFAMLSPLTGGLLLLLSSSASAFTFSSAPLCTGRVYVGLERSSLLSLRHAQPRFGATALKGQLGFVEGAAARAQACSLFLALQCIIRIKRVPHGHHLRVTQTCHSPSSSRLSSLPPHSSPAPLAPRFTLPFRTFPGSLFMLTRSRPSLFPQLFLSDAAAAPVSPPPQAPAAAAASAAAPAAAPTAAAPAADAAKDVVVQQGGSIVEQIFGSDSLVLTAMATLSGTAIAYGGPQHSVLPQRYGALAYWRRVCFYALPGTDRAYAATRLPSPRWYCYWAYQ
eukprot:674793-Rhodomonas_salina.1